ncbi:MAG: hypothetical protein U1F43_27505 [Myxococcota bacterium]
MRMRSSGPSCFRYEEPLKALRLALDPTGPNPDQQGALVRGDAILAVVVLTDEEDCSTAAGATIDEASYDRCGLLGATDEGGPLTPATDYIDFLRG